VKSSGTANAAIASPRGPDSVTASLSIWSRAHMVAQTALRTVNGVVGERTAVTLDAITPECSLHLSGAEERWLHRIRLDRERGFMVSGVDVDFVLEVLRRLGA